MTAGNIDPNRKGWELFKSLPRDEPVHMLNLIRLKEKADYPADHPNHGKGLNGRDAYAAYGKESGPVFRRLGGRIVWSGEPQAVVTGPADEHWDLAFVAEYPTAAAFLAMVADPVYRQAVKHRTAAVADSRLIRHKPLKPGEGFGG